MFDVDWKLFAGDGPGVPFLERLLGADDRVPSAAAPATDPALRLDDPATATIDAVEAFCRAAVAASLGVPADAVDGDGPIRELGFDSLMALETRNRLRRGAGVSIPVVRLLDGSSVRDLARQVFEETRPRSTGAVRAAGDRMAADEARALLARLSDLSDADVDALLNQLQPDL